MPSEESRVANAGGESGFSVAPSAVTKKLADSGNTYWATEVEIQQKTIAAWIAWARGERQAAREKGSQHPAPGDREEQEDET